MVVHPISDHGPTDVVHPISDHGPTDMVVHPISDHGPTDMVVHPISDHGPTDVVHPIRDHGPTDMVVHPISDVPWSHRYDSAFQGWVPTPLPSVTMMNIFTYNTPVTCMCISVLRAAVYCSSTTCHIKAYFAFFHVISACLDCLSVLDSSLCRDCFCAGRPCTYWHL